MKLKHFKKILHFSKVRKLHQLRRKHARKTIELDLSIINELLDSEYR